MPETSDRVAWERTQAPARRGSTVPVFSLDAIDAQVDPLASMRRVVATHRYVLGPAVQELEQRFAEYCGVGHCVGVANGTDALELALRALGVGSGDRVAVAANAGYYASTAVRLVGAVPVYIDVDAQTLAMAAPLLAEVASEPLAAAVVTHLYGQLADMDALLAVTERLGIPIVEDSAQAHGARCDGRRAGSWGQVGCFSFYPTKNLGGTGDGGAVVTDGGPLADRVRQLRQYGWNGKYNVELRHGRNSRLDEVQAALLSERLPFLDGWNAERRAIARRYVDALRDLPIILPASLGDDYVAHLFVVRTSERAALRQHLDDLGIGTDVHYPVADHLQVAYRHDEPTQRLPETEAACASVLTLPCYPGLSADDQSLVIEAVRSFFLVHAS